MGKHDLKDTTFIIPFHSDSIDRIENLYCIMEWIRTNFDTTILMVEEDVAPTVDLTKEAGTEYIFVKRTIPDIFYRTKVINVGIRSAKTPYIAIWDADVIVDSQNCYDAVHALRHGRAKAIYPYGGDFVDIARSFIVDGIKREQASFTKDSVGGGIFLNREDYINVGIENENIVGWGFEDRCRYNRMTTIGFPITHTDGRCYHITHSRGINSSNANPYDKANEKEYYRIKNMNKIELLNEIKTWSWKNQ